MTVSEAIERTIAQVTEGVEAARRHSGSRVVCRVVEFDLAVRLDATGDLAIDPSSSEGSSRIHVCLDLEGDDDELFPGRDDFDDDLEVL